MEFVPYPEESGLKLGTGWPAGARSTAVDVILLVVDHLGDRLLQRPAAIKVLDKPPRGTLPGAEVARFWREARVLAALKHPHIVRLYEFAPPEGERPAYLVMEFVEGQSLRSLLDHEGPLPGEVVAMVGCRLAAALHVAHEQGVITGETGTWTVSGWRPPDLLVGKLCA
jgi:serine/threonine protein kinase